MIDSTSLVQLLREHWLTSIECDHEAKTDVSTCFCAKWRSVEQPNVAEAVARWIEHVLSHLRCECCGGSGEIIFNTKHGGDPDFDDSAPCVQCEGTGYSSGPNRTLEEVEAHLKLTRDLARYRNALQRANGLLILHDLEPVKLEYQASVSGGEHGE